MLMLRLKQH
jgi:hypothetical protein